MIYNIFLLIMYSLLIIYAVSLFEDLHLKPVVFLEENSHLILLYLCLCILFISYNS